VKNEILRSAPSKEVYLITRGLPGILKKFIVRPRWYVVALSRASAVAVEQAQSHRGDGGHGKWHEEKVENRVNVLDTIIAETVLKNAHKCI